MSYRTLLLLLFSGHHLSCRASSVLKQPNISIRPSSGEVIRGETFTIICSAWPEHAPNSFQLIMPNNRNISREADFTQNASFIFTDAQLAHQGNYSCEYKTANNTSPRSDVLTVQVRESLLGLMMIVGGAIGSAVLVVSLITIISCLVCKRKTQTEQVTNDIYHNETGSDSSSEPDYVNASVENDYVNEEDYMDSQRNEIPRDHEEQSELDENDYVNTATLQLGKGSDSDSEADYQNVFPTS